MAGVAAPDCAPILPALALEPRLQVPLVRSWLLSPDLRPQIQRAMAASRTTTAAPMAIPAIAPADKLWLLWTDGTAEVEASVIVGAEVIVTVAGMFDDDDIVVDVVVVLYWLSSSSSSCGSLGSGPSVGHLSPGEHLSETAIGHNS